AIVPGTFLFANVVEYLAHRFLMHVPRPVVRFLYTRHTLQHHRFFIGDYLAAESARDWKIVMFPPALLFFFLGCIGLPLSLAISALSNENLGALFGATAAGYFLIYECCHLAWHQPEHSLVARLPLVRRFCALHRAHHLDDTRGFNVTFPIADTLFRTTPRAI
ncbi:MAG TPA: sterol desaturase family protein, partial [Myxococcota bacterium]